MANRHLSRSIVLQTLFELDFREERNEKIAEDILIRNMEEFAPGVAEISFMTVLTKIILGKYSEIDQIISKAAPDWPLEKISIIDRNILRLGLAELLFADRSEVPAKVAINEAIELGKTFGGESSGRFINGVLGAVYREIGEPGKDDKPKNKKDIAFEDMPIERKAGAVIYSMHEGDIYMALVHDVFGHWTLSKGGIEKDEAAEEGVLREIKEELGLDIKVIEEIGNNEYVANHPEKGKHRKQVIYFLAESEYKPLALGESGGLDDAKWFKLKEILDLNFYDDILPLVTKAIKKIAEISAAGK
jgi:transcription antitermination protein NusB